MAEQLFAFRKQTAEKLLQISQSISPQISSSENLQKQPKVANRKMWIFTPKTAISAAPGGIAGTNYEVGSGKAYILELNRETKILEKLTKDDGTWDYKTVYNHHESAIPDEDGTIFFGIQDWRGNFWVADIDETGESGTGTGCLSSIAGVDLNDLPEETTAADAPYVLGINSSGCLCKIPTKACP